MIEKSLHFTVNAESVVALCRQAWLYEDKEAWALKTLGYLAMGITPDMVDSILHGINTLKSTEDGCSCNYVKEEDESWLLEVQKHNAFMESRYYTFAGRKVESEIVNIYTHSVVARLRNAIRTPGLMQLENPIELMRIEEQRRQMHHEIFKAAGFTSKDIRDFDDGCGSDEFCDFANELSKFVNNETNWGTKKES